MTFTTMGMHEVGEGVWGWEGRGGKGTVNHWNWEQPLDINLKRVQRHIVLKGLVRLPNQCPLQNCPARFLSMHILFRVFVYSLKAFE